MFVAVLTYNREFSREEPLFLAHRDHVVRHVEASEMLCSGPRIGANGGLMIVYGQDEAEARALVDQDPFVQDGLASYELFGFTAGLVDPAATLPGS
jgi:uncharacterized protein YciI